MNNKYENPGYDALYELHYNQQLCARDMCHKFNVTAPVMYRWFKECNFPYRNTKTDKNIPPKEELIKLHHDQKMRLRDLAVHYKTSFRIVKLWLETYNIEQQMHRKKRKWEHPNKETLMRLHYTEGKSFVDIAKLYEISATMVAIWYKDACIENNSYMEPPDYETLYRLHITERKTFREIAKIYNIADPTISIWYKRAGIENTMYKVGGESKAEEELLNFIKTLDAHAHKTRKILGNLELDAYSEQYRIAVEYCGLYWHSELFLPNNYHINKLNKCTEKEISLITLFEDEWLEKQEICKSIIRSKFNMPIMKIWARKCEIKQIEPKEAKEFLSTNHLQGKCNSCTHAFGLFYLDKLVAVMTFGKHHRGGFADLTVLNRLCFRLNVQIIGGAQKLFKYALKHINTNIVSWSDKRWSQGKVYEQLGFTKDKDLLPDYSYFKSQQRFPKQQFQKRLIGCPKNISEAKFVNNMGYHRIWDCGKERWIYINTLKTR